MEKLEYLIKTLSRTNKKDYENYVINAIYHRVGEENLIPVTQQYVKRNEGYAKLDLYFPQLSIAIEIDEPYHEKCFDDDKRRMDEILSAVSVELDVYRVNIVPGDYDSVEKQINDIVENIKKKINGQKLIWICDKDKLEEIKNKHLVTINDCFNNMYDIMYLFNKQDLKDCIRGEFLVSDKTYIWSPTITKKINGKLKSTKGWINKLSYDWDEITEYKENSDYNQRLKYYEQEREHGFIRYTFAKFKDNMGIEKRRYIGTFKVERIELDGTIVRKRIATKFEF